VSIRKLDQEIQERIRRAMASLKSPDPDNYYGTAEREYQKELARILQKEGNKAANASTDQLIAGKLKSVGYGVHEIEEVIENHSPMAVKPTQEQRKIYSKTTAQKAHFIGENNQKKRINDSNFYSLDKQKSKIYKMPLLESFFVRPNFIPEDIRSAIANLMRKPVKTVAIYNSDSEEAPTLDEKISYLIDYSNALGDFPVHLTIYPHFPSPEEWLTNNPKRLAFISEFCGLMSGEALVEIENDSEEIEEGWLLVDGDGVKGEVLLDEERIIDDGSFVISSVRPYLIS